MDDGEAQPVPDRASPDKLVKNLMAQFRKRGYVGIVIYCSPPDEDGHVQTKAQWHTTAFGQAQGLLHIAMRDIDKKDLVC